MSYNCVPQPTFSGVLLNFKFGTVYRLAHMWLQICSSLTKLHWRFLEKWLPWKFSFEKFMGSMKVVKETTLTVEKEPLVLVLPYCGLISQQCLDKTMSLSSYENNMLKISH